MNRILFVDDEPRILSGLRRVLHGYRDTWDMHFVGSGEAALAALTTTRFDVLVTDMAMPVMNGAQLLQQVRVRRPDTLRVVLSGFADFPEVEEAARAAHLFLLKPCESETLRALMDRATRVQQLVGDGELRKLVGGIAALPSPPDFCLRLNQLVSTPGATIRDVAALVEGDVAVTAKVLQLVNSAYFGLSRRLTSAREAVVYLGMNVVRNLVLSAAILDSFAARAQVEGFSLDAFSRRAFKVARVAKAMTAGTPLADDAFVAGLLHDAGLLLLANTHAEKLNEALADARKSGQSVLEAERAVFGASHAEVGAALLGYWGFSFPVVDAVAHLHDPPLPGEKGPSLTSFVSIARALVDEKDPQAHGPFEAVALTTERVEATGTSARLDEWRGLVDAA